MAIRKSSTDTVKLGVLTSDQALYFAETVGTQMVQSFSIPTSKPLTLQPGMPTANFDANQMTLRIQETLRQRNIRPSAVYLTIPSNEIIFRSFIIPAMQPNEIKGVVAFESRKYIPFPLEELMYHYQTIPVTKQEKKLLRVIFVAVKKKFLGEYTPIFENLRLEISLIEPAFLSTLRTLTYNNFFPKDQTVGIIEQQNDWGRITVVDQGVPHFVREVQLKAPSPSPTETNIQDLTTRLINETKISFDYFARQESTIIIKKLLYIAGNEYQSFVPRIQEELKVDIAYASPAECMNAAAPIKDMEIIPAFGATLANIVPLSSEFPLSPQKTTVSQPHLPSSTDNKINQKSIIATAVICSIIFGLFLFLSKQLVTQPSQRLATLQQKLGQSESINIDSLREKNKDMLNKLHQFEKMNIKSNFAFFLDTIPKILPKDAWLKTFNIYSQDQGNSNTASEQPPEDIAKALDKGSRVTLELAGYVYSSDAKDQVALVNNFLKDLKSNSEFSSYFKDITRKNVKLETLEGFEVTSFEIKCQ